MWRIGLDPWTNCLRVAMRRLQAEQTSRARLCHLFFVEQIRCAFRSVVCSQHRLILDSFRLTSYDNYRVMMHLRFELNWYMEVCVIHIGFHLLMYHLYPFMNCLWPFAIAIHWLYSTSLGSTKHLSDTARAPGDSDRTVPRSAVGYTFSSCWTGKNNRGFPGCSCRFQYLFRFFPFSGLDTLEFQDSENIHRSRMTSSFTV